VKKTLACSLHEVARILSTTEEVPGPNDGFGSESPRGYEDQDQGYSEYFMDGVTLVERELIPVFESMLQVSCVAIILSPDSYTCSLYILLCEESHVFVLLSI
jgi:hypothetical protein